MTTRDGGALEPISSKVGDGVDETALAPPPSWPAVFEPVTSSTGHGTGAKSSDMTRSSHGPLRPARRGVMVADRSAELGSRPPLRISAIVGVGLLEALLIAAVLRAHMPEITPASLSRSRVHGTLAGGHEHHGGGSGGSGNAPSIVAEAVPHFAGLAALAAHFMVVSLIAVTALLRGRFGGNGRRIDAFRGRLGYAAITAVVTAACTAPVASFSLRNAFGTGDILAIAVDVLRLAFVLALLAGAVLGPPWQPAEPSSAAKRQPSALLPATSQGGPERSFNAEP